MTTALATKNTNDIAVRADEIQYDNVGQMLSMAQVVLESGLANSFKTPQQVIVAWQYAKALKLAPMAALTSIAVINGKPSLYGAALPGVATASGQVESWKEQIEGEGDNMLARCRVRRKGIEGEIVGEFSMLDAKRAGLDRNQTYQKYPKDMLMWKARARAFRPLFGDVLCGMPVYEDLISVEEKKPLVGTASVLDPLQKGKPNAEPAHVQPEQGEVGEVRNPVSILDEPGSYDADAGEVIEVSPNWEVTRKGQDYEIKTGARIMTCDIEMFKGFQERKGQQVRVFLGMANRVIEIRPV